MPAVGWCENCNVPIINARDCGLCGSSTKKLKLYDGELKPVFPAEKRRYKEVIALTLGMETANAIPRGLCFYSKMGELIIDGEKVFRIFFDKKTRTRKARLFKSFSKEKPKLQGSNLKKTINANKYILEEMEQESISFLKHTIRTMPDLPIAVSFSGGKDSTTVLSIARNIDHIKDDLDVVFLNTTIEFEETVHYVRWLADKWNLNLVEVTPPHEFFELCKKLGPPSIYMKWCCKTQKFAPMNALINRKYPNGVLVISGLRAVESRNRKNFQKVQRNKLIPKQILAFPIYEWGSLDVWLYLLWRKIPFNQLYQKGFSRLGCWACPEKSPKKLKLIEETHPNLVKKFQKMLLGYAKKEGFTDAEDWVYKAKWRLRVSRYKHKFVCTTRPCSISDQFIYKVKHASYMKQVEEFMKIFGDVHKNGAITRIINSTLQISIVGDRIRVELNAESNGVLRLFEQQLEKAINCIHCGACLGACKVGALRIQNKRIVISDDCTHCLECIRPKGIRKGCISLNYKPHLLSINNPRA